MLEGNPSTGYVWRLDPLAKERGTPTRALRGPLRAKPAAGSAKQAEIR